VEIREVAQRVLDGVPSGQSEITLADLLANSNDQTFVRLFDLPSMSEGIGLFICVEGDSPEAPRLKCCNGLRTAPSCAPS
jgi:hypothetical protein